MPIVPLQQIKELEGKDRIAELSETFDIDKHIMIVGASGAGKDTLGFDIVVVDYYSKRNIIIFDVKGEYIGCALPNIKLKFQKKMHLLPQGLPVTVWIPINKRILENKRFIEFLKLVHPNIDFRPFRILQEDLTSQDALDMAMQLSQLQAGAMAAGMKGYGPSGGWLKHKQEIAEKVMFFDFKEGKWDNCEYIDFKEMFKNNRINIIDCSWALNVSTANAANTMVAILSEILSVSQTVLKKTAIYILEIGVMAPEEASSRFQDVAGNVHTKIGQLARIARSASVRMRLISQKYSDYKVGTQANIGEIYCGRLAGKELDQVVSAYGLTPDQEYTIRNLRIGEFATLRKWTVKSFPSPPQYKPDEGETGYEILKQWHKDPLKFNVKKFGYSISDLSYVDVHMTEDEFLRRTQIWIKKNVKEGSIAKQKEEEDTIKQDIQQISERIWMVADSYEGKEIDISKHEKWTPNFLTNVYVLVSMYMLENYDKVLRTKIREEWLDRFGIDLERIPGIRYQKSSIMVPGIFDKIVSDKPSIMIELADKIEDLRDYFRKIQDVTPEEQTEIDKNREKYEEEVEDQEVREEEVKTVPKKETASTVKYW